MPRRKQPFDNFVIKTDTCWLWRAARGRYGRFYLGLINGRRQYIQAHHYAWERANRPLRPGEIVRHICDNPPCVRPDHLAVGSYSDNMRDAAAKNRIRGSVHGKGEQHRYAKLTDDAVRAIRDALSHGETQRIVAERFSVNPSQISRIASGARWRHV